MNWLTESRRLWLYSVAAAAIALLTAYGILSPYTVHLWTSLAVAVLAVGSTGVAAAHVGESGVDDYQGRHRREE